MGRTLIPFAAGLLMACGPEIPQSGAGGIAITHAYLAEPVTSEAAAVYLTLTNAGRAPDTLVDLGAAFADHGELHRVSSDDGRMIMRPVNGVAVGPGETVLLEPGGYHGMLVRLTRAPKHAEEAVVTLTFARAGTVTVTVPVVPYTEIEDRAAQSRRAAGLEPRAQ